jgi:hypothetical protein
LYSPTLTPSFRDYPYFHSTKCDKVEKNNIIASKKSLKKLHHDEFLQQSSKISEMHRTLNNYVVFSTFFSTLKSPTVIFFGWLCEANVLKCKHSWLITGFVTKFTRRVPLVEQELLTFPEHLSSPQFSVEFVLLDL